jgi:hypothetical protein
MHVRRCGNHHRLFARVAGMKYLLLILALAGCGDGGGLLDDPAIAEKPEHVQTLTPEKS